MIAQRIKLLREKKGLSQKELAEYVKMSQQAIAKWETGNSEPDIKMINTLSDFFDVDLNYLIGSSKYPTPKKKEPSLNEKALLIYDGLLSIGIDPDELTENNFNLLLNFIDRNKELILKKSLEQ